MHAGDNQRAYFNPSHDNWLKSISFGLTASRQTSCSQIAPWGEGEVMYVGWVVPENNYTTFHFRPLRRSLSSNPAPISFHVDFDDRLCGVLLVDNPHLIIIRNPFMSLLTT